MVTIDNILRSGFTFGEGEDLLQFRFRMVNIMLFISIGAMLLFAAFHYVGFNQMPEVHAQVNFLSAILCMLAVFRLRQSKELFQRVVIITLCALIPSFTSALVNVPNDEFRMIWFVIGIIAAHLAIGRNFGNLFVVLSIGSILLCNSMLSLNIGTLTLTTAILSFIIIGLIVSSYSSKVDSYEEVLLHKNRELMLVANRDELTGIMSRRYFMDMGRHYFSGAIRSEKSMSLIMLDIDYFKKINDSYGHHIGDTMLMLFTETISSHLRKSDIFARLGGEEFGIILFETDIEGAMILAEKIRNSIEELVYTDDDLSIKMTTSIGVGERKTTDVAIDELMIRTDRALYESKSQGRNRVSTSQVEGCQPNLNEKCLSADY